MLDAVIRKACAWLIDVLMRQRLSSATGEKSEKILQGTYVYALRFVRFQQVPCCSLLPKSAQPCKRLYTFGHGLLAIQNQTRSTNYEAEITRGI